MQTTVISVLVCVAVAFRVATLGLRDWREPDTVSLWVGGVVVGLEALASGSIQRSWGPTLVMVIPVFFAASLASRAVVVWADQGAVEASSWIRHSGRLAIGLGAVAVVAVLTAGSIDRLASWVGAGGSRGRRSAGLDGGPAPASGLLGLRAGQRRHPGCRRSVGSDPTQQPGGQPRRRRSRRSTRGWRRVRPRRGVPVPGRGHGRRDHALSPVPGDPLARDLAARCSRGCLGDGAARRRPIRRAATEPGGPVERLQPTRCGAPTPMPWTPSKPAASRSRRMPRPPSSPVRCRPVTRSVAEDFGALTRAYEDVRYGAATLTKGAVEAVERHRRSLVATAHRLPPPAEA